jgi:vitamin B12 transporter
MKAFFSAAFHARRSSVVVHAVLAGVSCGFVARGQTPPPVAAPAQLTPFFTTATRTPNHPHTLGSAVDVITAAELARRQVSSLAEALGSAAGAPLFASGAAGATTSVFLRGANSNQTLFLVDGLRISDPNTNYEVFLGGSCVSACDSLEIAHGPQSTLYGGEAVGGVVSLRAQRGAGEPSGRTFVEAGSFGTVQGAFSAQGERGASAWNFAVQGGQTDNDRANNAFESANATFRFDHQWRDRVNFGSTLRWFQGVYGDPGDRYTNDPDNQSRESNLLVTTFATLTLAPDWTAHAVLGGQDRRFVAESPRAGRATAVTVVKNRRGVLDAQTTFSGLERHRLTGGFTAEANHTRNTGFGNINRRQTLLAVFAQDEFSPHERVSLTAGVRNDDFDTFGRATTGRGTAAWRLALGVKLRASYGTAFRSPSFLDLYGESAFYRGNPNLRPERARGWDAGADYTFAAERGTLSATWFEMAFRDLIASTPSFRSVENIQRARTQGVEVAAKWILPGTTHLSGSYTYLEADNLTAGTRLLRRPRHRVSADVSRDFGSRWVAGAGVAWTAQREDIHARTFVRVDGEDFAVVRIYGTWQVSERLSVKGRLENLLDENYEEVNGYPSLGFGAFGGMEWRF